MRTEKRLGTILSPTKRISFTTSTVEYKLTVNVIMIYTLAGPMGLVDSGVFIRQ